MSKFKVGAEVKAISASFGWGAVTKGDIGHVLSIDSDDELQVDFPAHSSWNCHAENLELVEPKSDQDQVKALLKGANIGATMIGDALAKSQEAELTTRYGDRYKQYVDVATKQYNCRCTLTPTIKEYPNPPRKHKDAIIAWANGADIEIQDKIGEWHDIKDPTWYERGAYRIKPTKTPLELKIEKCEAELAKLKGQL